MITVIAELATNHGGNLDIAKRMIDDAAEAGANMVKTQAYDLMKLNSQDPQADWLMRAHLTEANHEALKAHADAVGIVYFASAFDKKSSTFVRNLCGRVKYASSVSPFEIEPSEWVYKTHAWQVPVRTALDFHTALVTVPLYPTPLECVGRVQFSDSRQFDTPGWSDHCVGLSGCTYALAHGAPLVEVHMTTDYAARQCAWDKTPEQIRELRWMCDDMETIRTGVSQTFRERWQR